jgi:hypothetical protein
MRWMAGEGHLGRQVRGDDLYLEITGFLMGSLFCDENSYRRGVTKMTWAGDFVRLLHRL